MTNENKTQADVNSTKEDAIMTNENAQEGAMDAQDTAIIDATSDAAIADATNADNAIDAALDTLAQATIEMDADFDIDIDNIDVDAYRKEKAAKKEEARANKEKAAAEKQAKKEAKKQAELERELKKLIKYAANVQKWLAKAYFDKNGLVRIVQIFDYPTAAKFNYAPYNYIVTKDFSKIYVSQEFVDDLFSHRMAATIDDEKLDVAREMLKKAKKAKMNNTDNAEK